MSKEQFIEAHEELVEEYLEANPNATDAEAYDRTADAAYGRMTDRMADMADHYRQLREDRML